MNVLAFKVLTLIGYLSVRAVPFIASFREWSTLREPYGKDAAHKRLFTLSVDG
jgi:hypothetical protein